MLTCVDVESQSGKLLAFGSSDLSVGILDAQTLAVSLFNIAGFPDIRLKLYFEAPPRYSPRTRVPSNGAPI
jgi:hypothetical protein